MKKVLFIIAIFFIYSQSFAAELSIPSNRIITWQDNVGVDGGIPTNFTKYGSTIQTADQVDDTSAIQTALNAAGPSQYVELGTGNFTITSGLSIPSNTELRGQGMGVTFLDCSGGSGENGFISIYGSFPYAPSGVSWTSGYTKGTSTITVASTSGMSVGQVLLLDVVNDESTLVFETGTTGNQTTERQSGQRALSQMTVITAINGNNISIDPPLYYDYPSGLNPEVVASTSAKVNAGIRDLTINGTSVGDNFNIKIGAGRNLWVTGVESSVAKRAHISVRNGTRITIFGNYIHESQSYASVSYGFELGYNSSGVLLENNIARYMVTPVVTYGSISGSVISYNYFRECAYKALDGNEHFLTPAIGFHGAHAWMNLVEGNIGWNVLGDNYWGSSSHNTIFRNRLYGDDDFVYDKYQNYFAVGLNLYSYNYNIISNVLGTDGDQTSYEFKTTGPCSPPGGIYYTGVSSNSCVGVSSGYDSNVFTTLFRHANYDYVNDTYKICSDAGEPGCQSATNYNYPTDTIPYSLYLTTQPSWLPNYPAVDPSNPGSASNAAETAFNSMVGGIPQWPVGDPTAPVSAISTSDPQTIYGNSLTLTGTCTDAVGVTGVKYRLTSAPDADNGTACTCDDGTCDGVSEAWTCTATTGYSNGSNNMYVGCTDAYANWGSGDSIAVNYYPISTHNGFVMVNGNIQ